MFAAFLSSLLFSVSVACGYRSAKLIGGVEANFWRLTCAGLFLGLWAYLFGFGLSGPALPAFLVSGVIGIGVGDGALFQALPRMGSRLSSLIIQCLNAPFGALIEWLWLGTTLQLRQVLCIVVILAGVGVALTPSEHLKLPRRVMVAGSLFCILSAIANAYGAVLSRKAYAIATAAHLPMDGGTAAFQRVLGGLFIAAICLLIVKRQAFKVQASAPAELITEASKKKWRAVWPWVVVNATVGQTLGVSCMQWALKSTPTAIVLAIIAITPLTIIPVSYVLEKERPTIHSVVGGIIAVAGVIALTLWR